MKFGCQSMVGKIKSILIKHPKDAFISEDNLKDNYEKYNYTSCPNYEKVLEEFKVFEHYIRTNVENVQYLDKSDYGGLDSIYTHDSVKITKKGAIYFPMGKELRSREYLATKDKLESLGINTLGIIKAPGKIEGGDILWIDEKTVAIGRGYRTNDDGINQFKELIKDIIDEVVVVPMPHAEGKDSCLHLMSIISFVDDNLAVVYSKYMPVFFREYLINKNIKLLEVSDQEYDNLGCNVLALSPRKCLIVKGNDDIRQKLLNEGVEVIEYEGYELSYKGTGGPTCLTCPIMRE